MHRVMLASVALSVAALTACGESANTTAAGVDSTAALGTFEGILPCADCAGIRTNVTLYTEQTSGKPARYELSETYLQTRDGDRVFTKAGHWTLLRGSAGDNDAVVFQLDYDQPKTARSFLKVGDHELRLLDRILSFADQDTSPITRFLNVGVGGNGLLAQRSQDEFGIAYAYTDLSDELKDNLDLLPLGGRLQTEQQVEHVLQHAHQALDAVDLRPADRASGSSFGRHCNRAGSAAQDHLLGETMTLQRIAAFMLAALGAMPAHAADKPNIVFILMDNLGYGEVGVYGGGVTRGAPTPRVDKLASEGTRLTNFNVEAQCTPSRAAILTGRFSIRSGTHSVPIGGGLDGLTQWETTLAEVLSGVGYATAAFGKWHLGSSQGRLPNSQGFDEWYGIPRTTDEAFWPSSPAAVANGVSFEHTMEGRKGEQSRELAVYDLKQRASIDEEITRRTIDFMKRSVQAGKPFYAYVPFTLVHFPTLPNPKFAGKTGFGDFPDALAEMDVHVGELLDTIDQLGARDNTIVVFTSDNGPEATWPWQGSSGPWRGYYFTHMEGSLRTPFIIRWPGRVPAGRVSNEIVHEVDTFTTFANIAGAQVPGDRAIDGVDQSEFLFGKIEKSSREGFPVFVADRLEAVKWRNWKVVFYDEQRDWWSPPTKLGSPKAFDLITDPKEEFPATGLRNTWNAESIMKIAAQFAATLRTYPPIAPGTPDPYSPPKPRR